MEFLPKTTNDEDGKPGKRNEDNLIESWISDKNDRKVTFEYVSNRSQLLQLDPETTEYTFGE